MAKDPISTSSKNEGNFLDVPSNYQDPWPTVRTDFSAFNNLIVNTGIVFQHWKAMPCVLGVNDTGDIHHSHDHTHDEGVYCENGYIYFLAGEVYGTFTANSKSNFSISAGYVANAPSFITFNRFYKNTDKLASFSEWDKLIPCNCANFNDEVFTTNFQTFQHNTTGIDRLQFKAIEVESLMDSNGKFYQDNTDFILQDGQIRWLESGVRPGLDPLTGSGRICSIRYKYKPFYYIASVTHDIRLTPTMDQVTGRSEMKMMAPACQVMQDVIFVNLKNNSNNEPQAYLDPQDGGNASGPR